MKLKIVFAVLSLMSAGAFAADATALSGSQSGSVAGAVVETPINMDSHASTKVLDFVSVQVAPLPPTLVSANGKFEKFGGCDERVVIQPFERVTLHPVAFGAWNQEREWKTEHGIFMGYAADQKSPLPQFVVRTLVLPHPFKGKRHKLIGHQRYASTETVAAGGGGSGAANYASERVTGIGNSLNSNTAFMVSGELALDCEYQAMDEVEVTSSPAEPKPPVNTCPAKRAGPGVKKGDVLEYKDGQRPAECDNG